jgi:hypothetical protein
VIQEKINIPESKTTIESINRMEIAQQTKLTKDLCYLIVTLGYIDCHFDNMCLLENGKLCIFDEEPMGALIASHDKEPTYDLSMDQCGLIGLQRLIDCSRELTGRAHGCQRGAV